MPCSIHHIAIVLPAYNEEKDLPALLDNIRCQVSAMPFGYTVIVVDDGSKDSTARICEEKARQMPLKLLRHGVNKGLGEALQTGLREGWLIGDAVVVMDADNTHNPAHIREMAATLASGRCDVVIASRFRKGSVVQGVPYLRQLMSWGCFLSMKALLPYRNVRDYSTGFRAYSSAMLGRLISNSGAKIIHESSFACMLELLLRLRWLGARVEEIPYTLRYDLKEGASKMRVWRTIKRYFGVVSRYWALDQLPQRPEQPLHVLREQYRAIQS